AHQIDVLGTTRRHTRGAGHASYYGALAPLVRLADANRVDLRSTVSAFNGRVLHWLARESRRLHAVETTGGLWRACWSASGRWNRWSHIRPVSPTEKQE